MNCVNITLPRRYNKNIYQLGTLHYALKAYRTEKYYHYEHKQNKAGNDNKLSANSFMYETDDIYGQ